MKYETVVCSEMPMFPAQMVSLLQLSNLDLVMNELLQWRTCLPRLTHLALFCSAI